MNCFALKIIAKTEISQHLKKRMMASGVTDIFQIVVLAAGAHAALRRRGTGVAALVLSEKHVFKLHHARVGKQQGGIIARYQAG